MTIKDSNIPNVRPDSMADVSDRLADFTLLLFAFLGLPTVVISLLRIREFGWLSSMYLHLGVYILLVTLYIFRRRIPHQIKAGLVLVLLFILGSGSFPTFATAGSGVFFYLVIVVLGTLYFGFTGGLIFLILCIGGLLTAMAATLSGYIDPKVDLNLYSLSVSSWTSKIAAFTLLGGLSLGLMSMMQKWLMKSLREMSQEIEERKQAESILENSLAEKEILLREVHHRVKSNLQVIMGLLDLHLSRASTLSDSRAISDSKNRLKVMAEVHENLYSSGDLTSIDFSIFLQNLVSGMVESYALNATNVDLDLQLESANLIVDTAIPCGLIVNELVSNSLKYAFKDRKKGTIRIEFSMMDDDIYRLVVADDGIGFAPDRGQTTGDHFGMRLIEAISQQLGAETNWVTEGGTVFTMVFKEYREAGAQVY